ncbi:MAG: hypothetical protein AAF495_28645 [Pseudomonadota bacterium]
MIYDLIATLAAGAGTAGLIYLVYRTVGRKAPRYLLPLAAGISMLSFAVWNEYSWFQRTKGQLPEQVRVVKTFTAQAPWQPWSYLVPMIDRFIAIDGANIRRNQALPGYALAEVIFVERRSPTVVSRQLFDCPGARRADVAAAAFDESGLPQDASWTAVAPDSLVFQAVCGRDSS